MDEKKLPIQTVLVLGYKILHIPKLGMVYDNYASNITITKIKRRRIKLLLIHTFSGVSISGYISQL